MPEADPTSRNSAIDGSSIRQRGRDTRPSALKVRTGSEEETSENDETRDWQCVTGAMVHAILPKWVDVGMIGFLIFGGCCGNVYVLEAIIKDEPSSGPLITFVQFITTALFTIPSFLSWSSGVRALFLSPRAIPLRSWLTYTIFFAAVNLLNNWAFAYRISIPLHIIVRSGGPVASMIIGYLYNSKGYSTVQILAVTLLTLGVVGAALTDADAQGGSMGITIGLENCGKSAITFLTGFTTLALAMILSAFQGVYADRLYAVHGTNHWREALLYSHLLSLPFFLPAYPQLSSQFRNFMSSPSLLSSLSAVLGDNDLFSSNSTASAAFATSTTTSTTSAGGNIIDQVQQTSTVTSILSIMLRHPSVESILAQTPVKILYLGINAITQYLCIRGVYLLAAKSSSLTVTIVLNIRKLVSLLFSIYIFGNSLSTGVLVGAGLVFLGGALYGVESARQKRRETVSNKNK